MSDQEVLPVVVAEKRADPVNRAIVGATWMFFMLVAFFVAANTAADEMGYDLNVKVFACFLIAGLAFVGLSAVVVRLFRVLVSAV